MRIPPRLRAAGVPLLLLALTLLHFAPLAFSGLILARGDTFNYFYPWWTARNAALMAGQVPLWSPDIFMGVPLLANPQPGTFYPLNWPLVPLAAPEGVRLSVLLHVFLALWGMYCLARHRLTAMPALAAALLFGLGGFVGAHVEQINQLQGMAWLPWLLLWLTRALRGERRSRLLLAAGLALQFLSGHTQTSFISGAGLALVALLTILLSTAPGRARRVLRALLLLLLAAAMALLLTLPQLLPTLELSSQSQRSGGLPPGDVLSFSFSPLVAGRGLLPGYEGLLFGEFVAYSGVIGLGLALLVLLLPWRAALHRERLLWGMLALCGLLLALGEFNPAWKLLAQLPGFNLFRVPARWLLLFALGSAMLGGIGLQSLLCGDLRPRARHLLFITAALAALMAASTLITRQPGAVIGPVAPGARTWLAWGLALAILLLLLRSLPRMNPARGGLLALVALGAELLLAGRVLPFNLLLPPETWSGQRFTVSQLRAWNADETPPGRFLSISELLFDPGDKDVLEAHYARLGLSPRAVRWGLVATKRQEILAPNLALAQGLPGVDGFGGGLLPTRWFTAFSSLLPTDALADGRLFLSLADAACRRACVPDMRWLKLSNTRYLISDKTQTLWHGDVAFDTRLAQLQGPAAAISSANPRGFTADALDLLVEPGAAPQASFVTAAGRRVPLTAVSEPVPVYDLLHLRLRPEAALTPQRVELRSATAARIIAATLVDTRDGSFLQLTPEPWRRLLSSDILVYGNDAVLPRAFLVPQARFEPDDEAALALMRDPDFDPTRTVLIHAIPPAAAPAPAPDVDAAPGTLRFTRYTATEIGLEVASSEPAWLVLSDAWYPGWVASVNGADVPLERANLMFRSLPLPAGDSAVTLRYQPAWLPGALLAGLGAWIVWLLAFGLSLRKEST